MDPQGDSSKSFAHFDGIGVKIRAQLKCMILNRLV